MDLLLPHHVEAVTDDQLRELYAFGDQPTLRANFVSTLDGAGTGADHLSGSINNDADGRIFHLQRTMCDAVLVGAGTADAEDYQRVSARQDGTAPPLVVVSNHARIPARAATAAPDRGELIIVTCASAGSAIDQARQRLGERNVWIVGEESVDLAETKTRLADAGLRKVLCEGGPRLFSTLLATSLIDQLALTHVPQLVGGTTLTRITGGPDLGVGLTPVHLLHEAGTLLGLWQVSR